MLFEGSRFFQRNPKTVVRNKFQQSMVMNNWFLRGSQFNDLLLHSTAYKPALFVKELHVKVLKIGI